MKVYGALGTAGGTQGLSTTLLKEFKEFASRLAIRGYLLRSGRTPGTEQAFECGCDLFEGRKEIYVPDHRYPTHWTYVDWRPGKRSNAKVISVVSPQAMKMSHDILYPGLFDNTEIIEGLMDKLYGRAVEVVLGPDLKSPIQFFVYASRQLVNEIPAGPAGLGFQIARAKRIPRFNLYIRSERDTFSEYIETLPCGY